jgi:pimeloyl-ACP methyl ester carboxylesterase
VTPEYVEKVIAPYRRPDYRDHATRYIMSMFPNPGTEALRERVLSEMLATPQHVMGSAMAGMFDLSRPAWDLPKVTIPVLAIHAKHSRWTPEYEAYVRSRSPRADYRVLEGTGHFVMLEKPAGFNAALREMLHQSR